MSGQGSARKVERGSLPRVVLVTRPTEYALLLQRHATHAQAAFFLRNRGQDIALAHGRYLQQEAAVASVASAVPARWRRSRIGREDLSRFVFEPEDVVVAIGQDGLVANTAKYLRGQVVIGVNPAPEQYDGVLVRHAPSRAEALLRAHQADVLAVEERTMVEACLDDGQTLLSLNEVFVGHRGHQSARYRIRYGGVSEHQSSSGVIVTTGTGATGWACSINRGRAEALALPGPSEPGLAYFVREAFPSVATGTRLTAGAVPATACLELVSELDEGGVIFGDGIEADYLDFAWGMKATIRVADTRLRLAC